VNVVNVVNFVNDMNDELRNCEDKPLTTQMMGRLPDLRLVIR